MRTTPRNGSTVNAVPREVTVTLSEDPTGDATLRIKDGCGNDVVSDVSVADGSIIASIAAAEPGRWTASWRAISSVDGHPTDGDFAFTVNGRKDCSTEEAEAEDEPPNGHDGGDAAGSNVQTGGSDGNGSAAADEGSSFPVVLVAAGAAALIVLALVARSAGAR